MNKNSFIAKFIYCYLGNLKDIKKDLLDVCDAVVKDLLPGLLYFLASFTLFLLRLLFCVLPVTAIWLTFHIEYLTKEQIKEATGVSKQSAYYLKEATPNEEKNETSSNT